MEERLAVRARHITSAPEYRRPFGAVQVGTQVHLAIDVWDDPQVKARLRLWVEGKGETLIPMTCEPQGDHLHFATTISCNQPQIMWYMFFLDASDGSTWRYGAKEEHACGEGAFAYGEPPSFQLTVYESVREQLPEWYKHGVVYQIFPDRFARGKDWPARSELLSKERRGPQRVALPDWNTPVSYQRAENGSIERWDFYGGTLEGIQEKLDYIAALGATVIYLNPIFDAASNHRYDTGDYLHIDPLLGDEEVFAQLCSEAQKRGISIILDGVFNHTGRDSRYFNAFGNYPELGAAQSEESPYRGWYHFHEDGSYDSWWGVGDLPDVNQDNPEYRQLICGQDGVIRKWLRLGARGWRLDVADELSDDFIADIKAAALAEKADAVVIGEVWEDASNKEAYGKLRHYFWGNELDGTMNYPFRKATLSFIRGELGAPQLAASLESLYENYPHENFACTLNILGSHDCMRVLTALGGAPAADELDEATRASYRLSADRRSLAVSRLWVAALLQMTMPGVPSVYYGDEAGLEGYADPYCRAPYPWDHVDKDCQAIYRNAIALRKSLSVLVDGDFEPFALDEDVFGFWRRSKDEQVCVLINRSLSKAKTIQLPFCGEAVDDVISGKTPNVAYGEQADAEGVLCYERLAAGEIATQHSGATPAAVEIFLWPLGTSVVYFHKKKRLQRPLEPGIGIMAHITSLPNADKPGHPGILGEPCHRFIDYLANAGVRYWQILPLNPTDAFGSPYAGLSAFAGNPALMWGYDEGHTAFTTHLEDSNAYRRFVEKNESWLLPYATFRAIKALVGEKPWQTWPEAYRTWSPQLVSDQRLAAGIKRECGVQFEFQRQWDELRRYAQERGVSIIGDVPMYVSADSADVWSKPELFNLDEHGYPAGQAGCPPDPLSEDGQLWGNPTYRWLEMADTHYAWWMQRFERMFELYDYVRLDHFLGFSSYYQIPQARKATEGQWVFGPGAHLFEEAYRHFGALPLIAEDLGSITPAVRALIAKTGFPGMDVIQFSDKDPLESFEPRAQSLVYSSTHDTQTLLGWVKSRYASDATASSDATGSAAQSNNVTGYATASTSVEQTRERKLADELLHRCVKSGADVVIFSLQDVLQLDDSCRMNVPGVAEGNWSWQATQAAVQNSVDYVKSFVKESESSR